MTELRAGVAIYQFVRDRQDDLRGDQHPEGHDTYTQSWRDAQALSQEYAAAVQAGNTAETNRLLNALTAMAQPWKTHPGFPATAVTGDAASAAERR